MSDLRSASSSSLRTASHRYFRDHEGDVIGCGVLGATGGRSLRIGDIGRSDLIHHVDGRIAERSLGTDIGYLDDGFLVGGHTREIGAVEMAFCARLRGGPP